MGEMLEILKVIKQTAVIDKDDNEEVDIVHGLDKEEACSFDNCVVNVVTTGFVADDVAVRIDHGGRQREKV